MTKLPTEAEIIVVGAGSAGCALAGRLAEAGRDVLVLEAGPDYGSYVAGGWPSELLDPRVIPGSHQWGYTSAAKYGKPALPLQRARVLGGCSSHNGMAAVWGVRDDYDAWERAGNPGWGTEALLPFFHAAHEKLRVYTPTRQELGAFHEAYLDAAPGAGIDVIDDINDLDGPPGVAVPPVNAPGGVRWNAAFGYLDPLRDSGSLRIAGDAPVARVLIEGGRAAGVVCVVDGHEVTVRATEVVISGGSYESPAILQRSGIGPAAVLGAAGVQVRHDLPGVGENLHDHPAYDIFYTGTPALYEKLAKFAEGRVLREEGVVAKLRVVDAHGIDLHIYPVANPGFYGIDPVVVVSIATMGPRSRGSVRIGSADPAALPVIDHGYLTDPEDYDLRVLLAGFEVSRAIAATAPLASVIGHETATAGLTGTALADHIRHNSSHYYHPAGSCKMGPASDPLAVVDAEGRVHGLAGLRVADASIMPVVPRANTNIPAVVVGERIAAGMLRG